MGQGWGGEDYGMGQGMGWGEKRDPKPSLLLDLLALAPMEKSLRPCAGLAPAPPPPKERQHRRVRVGLFTNILMSHLLLVFPFSAFVGRGRR